MSLSAEVWIAIAFIAGLTVVQCLATLAKALESEITRRKLAEQVLALREQDVRYKGDAADTSFGTVPVATVVAMGPEALTHANTRSGAEFDARQTAERADAA